MMITSEDAIAIAATVTVLTQIIKRVLPSDGGGPYITGILSLIAVALWVISSPVFPPDRTQIYSVFANWVNVYASAVGIYATSTMATSTIDRIRSARSSS